LLFANINDGRFISKDKGKGFIGRNLLEIKGNAEALAGFYHGIAINSSSDTFSGDDDFTYSERMVCFTDGFPCNALTREYKKTGGAFSRL